MKAPKYVPESADLKASRALEARTSWEPFEESLSNAWDRMKDDIHPLTGKRRGVPVRFSYLYDAKVAA